LIGSDWIIGRRCESGQRRTHRRRSRSRLGRRPAHPVDLQALVGQPGLALRFAQKDHLDREHPSFRADQEVRPLLGSLEGLQARLGLDHQLRRVVRALMGFLVHSGRHLLTHHRFPVDQAVQAVRESRLVPIDRFRQAIQEVQVVHHLPANLAFHPVQEVQSGTQDMVAE